MKSISAQCDGSNQTNFQGAYCAHLLRCVLDNLPSDLSAGMQSGGNVASLIPTILALIGAPPLDLVQLAMLSPHRALATCCFSIGLPSGLFRQLRPLTNGLAEKIAEEPKVREWVFQVPHSVASKSRAGWRNGVVRAAVDAVIIGLASVMLWYNWKISTQIMITWRCEYGWLLFSWPLACFGWLILAMSLLWAMASSVNVLYQVDEDSAAISIGLWSLMTLPYKADGVATSHALPTQQSAPAGSKLPPQTTSSASLKSIATSVRAPTVKISITMPHEHSFRSWRWYEAVLETLAVGIYLYATFVLTSTVFMSGHMALTYAALMTICLSAVRVLGTVV